MRGVSERCLLHEIRRPKSSVTCTREVCRTHHAHPRGLSNTTGTHKQMRGQARSGTHAGALGTQNANEARLTVGEATGVIPLEAAAGGRRLTFFFQGEINKADEFHRDVSQVHR